MHPGHVVCTLRRRVLGCFGSSIAATNTLLWHTISGLSFLPPDMRRMPLVPMPSLSPRSPRYPLGIHGTGGNPTPPVQGTGGLQQRDLKLTLTLSLVRSHPASPHPPTIPTAQCAPISHANRHAPTLSGSTPANALPVGQRRPSTDLECGPDRVTKALSVSWLLCERTRAHGHSLLRVTKPFSLHVSNLCLLHTVYTLCTSMYQR